MEIKVNADLQTLPKQATTIQIVLNEGNIAEAVAEWAKRKGYFLETDIVSVRLDVQEHMVGYGQQERAAHAVQISAKTERP